MPPKHRGSKWRQTETESEASPESFTDNQTNSTMLTEGRQSNGESGTQAVSSRGLTSYISNASSSGMGTSRSSDSGTSNNGITHTTSEGGNSNKNTQTIGGPATPLTWEDIPRLVRELARHFRTDNQDPQLSLVPGMFMTCDCILHGFSGSLSTWVVL